MFHVLNLITCSGECLGSRSEEGRSELRYAPWSAEFRETTDGWTHAASLWCIWVGVFGVFCIMQSKKCKHVYDPFLGSCFVELDLDLCVIYVYPEILVRTCIGLPTFCVGSVMHLVFCGDNRSRLNALWFLFLCLWMLLRIFMCGRNLKCVRKESPAQRQTGDDKSRTVLVVVFSIRHVSVYGWCMDVVL